MTPTDQEALEIRRVIGHGSLLVRYKSRETRACLNVIGMLLSNHTHVRQSVVANGNVSWASGGAFRRSFRRELRFWRIRRMGPSPAFEAARLFQLTSSPIFARFQLVLSAFSAQELLT